MYMMYQILSFPRSHVLADTKDLSQGKLMVAPGDAFQHYFWVSDIYLQNLALLLWSILLTVYTFQINSFIFYTVISKSPRQGDKNAGYDVLLTNMKQAVAASKEFHEILRERGNYEEAFSKSLRRLSEKASVINSVG